MSGIELRGVSKRFKDVTALDNVTLNFEENKIYGLLGRNGAGKSTMLNIISNRLFPDEGEVLLDGQPVRENDMAQGQIFLISEKTLYPEKMKIKEAFKWTQEFYPDFDVEKARSLAEEFGLSDKKKVDSLSTGYETIFKVILALCVNVPYVFFDEPVLGLDANHRELFYKHLLTKYGEDPFTAVISTHLIEEVSNVIEEIVIIKRGKIIYNESRDDLLGKGYTVSGNAGRVDSYIKGRDVIGTDSLGGLKTAYLLGRPDRCSMPEGLELTGMDLQKLFIQLTNE
ncbi:ATP-binding cassette domain-containing protein [Murimonas intestini]|uniref:ABC transporter ATP-binding protein n=1 Tax=Murimonas intestini TaxID=1337051 RepID=UPI0011DDA864|nr:ABC transporter ATP-binding protein [Murimonas intestini]